MNVLMKSVCPKLSPRGWRWLGQLRGVALGAIGLCFTTLALAAISPVLADGFVSAEQPNGAFWAWDAVIVKINHETQLEFDASKPLAAGTKPEQISKVTLVLYAAWVDSPGQVEVIRVPGTFNESTLTYANRPAHTGRGTGTVVTLGGSQQPVFVDVTKDFQAALREQAPKIRFVLLPALATPGVAVQFYSKESGRHMAMLDITLTSEPSAPSPVLFNAASTGDSTCTNVCAVARATAVANPSGQTCMGRSGRWASFEMLVAPNSNGIGVYFPSYYGCGSNDRTAQCVCRKF